MGAVECDVRDGQLISDLRGLASIQIIESFLESNTLSGKGPNRKIPKNGIFKLNLNLFYFVWQTCKKLAKVLIFFKLPGLFVTRLK